MGGNRIMQIVHMELPMAGSWRFPAPRGARLFYFVAFFSALAFVSGLFPSPAVAQYNSICMRERGHMDDKAIEACDAATALCMTAHMFAKPGLSAAERSAQIDDCINKSIRTGNNTPPNSESAPESTRTGSLHRCMRDFSDEDKVGEFALNAAMASCNALLRSPAATNHEMAEAHAWRAIDLEYRGQDNQTSFRALGEADTAIGLEPTLSEAYYARGTANYALGVNDRDFKHLDAASSDFSRFLSFGTQSQGLRRQAYLARGSIEVAVKRYELAVGDLSEAIRLAPHSAQAYYYRGIAEQQLGRNQAGDADIEAARQIDPSIGRGN